MPKYTFQSSCLNICLSYIPASKSSADYRNSLSPGNKENFEIRKQPCDQSVQWMHEILLYFFTGWVFVCLGAAVQSLVWISWQRQLLCTALCSRLIYWRQLLTLGESRRILLHFLFINRRILLPKVFGCTWCECVCMNLLMNSIWVFPVWVCTVMMAFIKSEGHSS